MNSKAIGIFDSGLGGLTAVKEISKLMPNDNIIYFGDTSRVPYGTRSNDTVIKYSKQDINFLLSFDLKAIVVACGTVSAVALPVIKDYYNIPIYGVLDFAAEKAAKSTKNEKIGVLGTNATIKSDEYRKKLLSINPNLAVINKACPMFVPLVENGYFTEDNDVATIIASEYLKPMIDQNVDTIILGCTHYPLLSKTIQKIVGDHVTLINPSKETAIYLSNQLISANANNNRFEKYFVSDTTDDFASLAKIFLEKDISGKVSHIDINQY